MVALYDYAGKSDDDLSIEQGDYILLIQHLDSDWSYGRLNGREGMFPRSYVESTGMKNSQCCSITELSIRGCLTVLPCGS